MTTLDYAETMFGKQDRGPKRSGAAPFSLRSRVLFGLALGGLLLGVVGGWAGTAKLSGAVIASGSVKVDQHVKEVQHADGGIVAEINVREGDVVEAGQVLLRLDSVQSRADLMIVSGQIDELRGRRARLLAERDGFETISFPERFAQADASLAEMVAGETQLFIGNLLGRTRQKEQLQLQVQQLEQEGLGLAGQLVSLDGEITLVRREREKLLALTKNGLVEGTRVYNIEREFSRLEGQRAEVQAGAARAKARIAEVRLQALGVDETARNEAQRELRPVDAQLAELVERQGAIQDRLTRTEIRSPIAGTVNEFNVTTIGGVITPAESLVTIVPKDAELTVEVRLATVDVDQIVLGQSAKLRFSAFNQRTTPEIDGRISHIAAAAQSDPQTGEAFYMAEVDISGDLPALGGLQLLPGMPVEVFVQTKELTAIAYLAKPFTDQIARAFREE